MKQQIEQFDTKVAVDEVGSVLSVGDGIARVYGLSKVMASELVEFPGGVYGMVLNLEEDNVACAVMGSDSHIKEGDLVRRTGRVVEVPVGENLIGRVVNSLGQPLDGKGPIESDKFRPVEVIAPGVVQREPVNRPLQTGSRPSTPLPDWPWPA